MGDEGDSEKLANTIKPLLKDVLDDLFLSLQLLENYLRENLKKPEDVREKKEECQIVVDIGRILREFPRKPNMQKRKEMPHADASPLIVPFLEKLDHAFDRVTSKLKVDLFFSGWLLVAIFLKIQIRHQYTNCDPVECVDGTFLGEGLPTR